MKTIIHLPTLCSMLTAWQADLRSPKSENYGIFVSEGLCS